jgi:hypothetical protein
VPIIPVLLEVLYVTATPVGKPFTLALLIEVPVAFVAVAAN